jgi:hypothetical protein
MDIQREVRLLKTYVLILGATVGVLVFAAFSRGRQDLVFEEISVERINVVEKDGTLRLVISNKTRQPDAVLNGRVYPRSGGKRAGMIFFNDEGTENGGLLLSGRREPNGTYQAAGGLLFDQFNQDHTIAFAYEDSNGQRAAGVRVWDQPNVPVWQTAERRAAVEEMPEGPEKTGARTRLQEEMRSRGWVSASRAFFGRRPDKAAVAELSDGMGKPRVRLVVDSGGKASLDFLDEGGRVTYSLPDSARRPSPSGARR